MSAVEIVSANNSCAKCRKPIEHGIAGLRCDFCSRVSKKLIGLQLAMYRNDLGDIDEWSDLHPRLERMFGSECTTEKKLIEKLIRHVQLELGLDESAALNVTLSDVVKLLAPPEREEQTVAPVVVLADAAAVKLTGRRGRLPKVESKLLETSMLAHLREHPSLKSDPERLAVLTGVSASTARRFIDSMSAKFDKMNRRE